jgi:hypothetical protein
LPVAIPDDRFFLAEHASPKIQVVVISERDSGINLEKRGAVEPRAKPKAVEMSDKKNWSACVRREETGSMIKKNRV